MLSSYLYLCDVGAFSLLDMLGVVCIPRAQPHLVQASPFNVSQIFVVVSFAFAESNAFKRLFPSDCGIIPIFEKRVVISNFIHSACPAVMAG